jgi:hypothetical protein
MASDYSSFVGEYFDIERADLLPILVKVGALERERSRSAPLSGLYSVFLFN